VAIISVSVRMKYVDADPNGEHRAGEEFRDSPARAETVHR
jgi:hypothetical protein